MRAGGRLVPYLSGRVLAAQVSCPGLDFWRLPASSLFSTLPHNKSSKISLIFAFDVTFLAIVPVIGVHGTYSQQFIVDIKLFICLILQVLIAYSRGMCVLWDLKNKINEGRFSYNLSENHVSSIYRST